MDCENHFEFCVKCRYLRVLIASKNINVMVLKKIRRSFSRVTWITLLIVCLGTPICLMYLADHRLRHPKSVVPIEARIRIHGVEKSDTKAAVLIRNVSVAIDVPGEAAFNNNGRLGFNHVYYDIKESPQQFVRWFQKRHAQCNGKFIGYANEVAIFHDVILDKSKCNGRRGGENFTSLWNQREDDEYYKFTPGFLQVNCTKLPQYRFTDNSHVNSWMKGLQATQGGPQDVDRYERAAWIGVTRYEYVNMYHTMTDWYNAFFVMTFFNLTQQQTNILLIDGHPWGSLDPVWATLFNSSVRLGEFPERTKFHSFITGHLGYSSPLFRGLHNIDTTKVALLEEFREFFLSSYGLPTDRPLNCNSLSLLFIWRRPYLAHPRNPSGDVHRKVKNEDEIMKSVQERFPHFRLNGIQTDALSMREQLRFVSESDILIGMHGAGLSLCLMLPKYGALLEFMPKYINPSFKKHFVGMATWRGIIYERWVNSDNKLEFDDHYTRIPPDVVIQHIESIQEKMCKKTGLW